MRRDRVADAPAGGAEFGGDVSQVRYVLTGVPSAALVSQGASQPMSLPPRPVPAPSVVTLSVPYGWVTA